MVNLILLPCLVLAVALISGAQAGFNNAYIQNVKSGRCININSDKLLDTVSTSKCDCGPYQFWKTDGNFVKNELAWHGFLDELWGKPGNGEPIGIYDKTGSAWQQWNINEEDDGTYTFVVKHTSKCMEQGAGGKVVQQNCDDDDPAQKWKVIQNPCGRVPKIPGDRLQLQNPATGKCAVIENDSNGAWAKVVLNKCSCGNDHQYWKLNTNTQMLPTIISQGITKQCFANWEKLGHPGITQCGCVDDPIHRWRFAPLENPGTFNLISQVDAKCASGGGKSSSPLQLAECDRTDSEQVWRVYDECNPEEYTPPPPPPPPPSQHTTVTTTVTNVIPNTLEYVFESGSMNWLSPTRYTLLVGGRWDAAKQIWYTADGREIAPNSAMWKIYFGDVKPSFLNVIFPGGRTWNEVFGWMDMNFFSTWTKWETSTQQQASNAIPGSLITYFNNGQMNWLNPTRFTLLSGGRWDSGQQTWYSASGQAITQGSPLWSMYFGNATPSFLTSIFGSNGSWNQVFGWMSMPFFTTWTTWNVPSPPEVMYVYDPPTVSYVYDPPSAF